MLMVSYCYLSLSVVSASCVNFWLVNTLEAKLAQNDHLDYISVKFEYGSCGVKNKVSRSTQRKTL